LAGQHCRPPITIEPTRQNFFVIGIYVVFISLKPETARGNVTDQSDIATYFVVSRTLVVAESENSYLSRNSYCRMHLAESRYFLSCSRFADRKYTPETKRKRQKNTNDQNHPITLERICCDTFMPFTCCISSASDAGNDALCVEREDKIMERGKTSSFSDSCTRRTVTQRSLRE
jgi:hypothetical protein